MRAIIPFCSLALLLTIGGVDLVSTAVLHAKGQIVELNPLMRIFIERSEWLFAVVKATTLIVAGIVMGRYARQNPTFVHRVCLGGSFAYIALWIGWFFSGKA